MQEVHHFAQVLHAIDLEAGDDGRFARIGRWQDEALEAVLLRFERDRQRALDRTNAAIEAQLALGATRHQALRVSTRLALRTALMPIINTMAAIGLVSLPGMMTGQILAGQHDRARGQGFETRDRAQQRRLATATWPEDGDHLP